MYCTGNNIYDKQVQGGSVLIIEPGTLCVFQKPKSVVCEVLKEGKIKSKKKIFFSGKFRPLRWVFGHQKMQKKRDF